MAAHKGRPRSAEDREKISASLKGRRLSAEIRRKISEARKGKHPDEETRKKISMSNKGKSHSEETKRKLSESHKGQSPNKGRSPSEETRKKISKALAGRPRHISDEALKRKLERMGMKPNKIERQLDELLQQEFPGEYRYVGDGKVIIRRKCPDFIATTKRRIIELLGLYWHGLFDGARLREHYRQSGFDTLIIWEDELRNIPKLINKVRKFTKH